LESFIFKALENLSSLKTASKWVMITFKEHGESMLGRDVDLEAHIKGLQIEWAIANASPMQVYNLAQTDNNLNISIAAASKRDSTAMKTIAIVTMVFLLGAYVAVS
jgi:hypothetical protein